MKKNFTFYLIGICGISMSSIALLLKDLGFYVSGSDLCFNEIYQKLNKNGIPVFSNHNKNNININDIVIYNSAISENNTELKHALKNNLVFSRVEFLCLIKNYFNISIGIGGCHGKTTCTSMLVNVFSDKKIYANIGGIDNNFGNYCFTGSNVFISEVCEYKKNINLFKTDIAVVLNIDFDHLECYSSKEELIKCYYNYLNKAMYKIVNYDDEQLKNYNNKNFISFAIKNKKAYYIAKKIKCKKGYISFKLYENNKYETSFKFKGICKHNVYNVLALICVCKILKINYNTIKNNLLKFNGVSRRSEYLGQYNKCEFYSDYAHHPKEILSTISSFEKVFNKKNILIIFQPHTYSRTKLLFNDFIKVLSKYSVKIFKTFPARETEDQGCSSIELSDALNVEHLENLNDIKKIIKNSHKKIVIFMGAGDLHYIVKEKFFK